MIGIIIVILFGTYFVFRQGVPGNGNGRMKNDMTTSVITEDNAEYFPSANGQHKF